MSPVNRSFDIAHQSQRSVNMSSWCSGAAPPSSVLVITRDRCFHLARLLKGLHSGAIGPSCKIFVIDDSLDSGSLARNRQVTTALGPARCHYVSQAEWCATRTRITEELALGSDQAEFLNARNLSAPGWNAGPARTVALMIATGTTTARGVLLLDDDVIVREPILCARTGLTLFALSGCPDYSRLHWIHWCLAAVSENYRARCAETCTGIDWEAAGALELHIDLLTRFTNAGSEYFPPVEKGRAPAFREYPCDELGHGCALAFDLSLSQLPIFPSTSQEDQFWTADVRRLGVPTVVSPLSVEHAPPRKNIFNIAAILVEEFGSLLYHAHQLVLAGFPPQSSINSILATRRRRIAKDLAMVEYAEARLPHPFAEEARRTFGALSAFLASETIYTDILTAAWRVRADEEVWTGLAARIAERGPHLVA